MSIALWIILGLVPGFLTGVLVMRGRQKVRVKSTE